MSLHLTFWFLVASGACAAWLLGSTIVENLPAITAYVKANPVLCAMLLFWVAAGASFWRAIR